MVRVFAAAMLLSIGPALNFSIDLCRAPLSFVPG
jgi:hypothetical protein